MQTSVTGKVKVNLHVDRVDTFSNGVNVKWKVYNNKVLKGHRMMESLGSRKILLTKAWPLLPQDYHNTIENVLSL